MHRRGVLLLFVFLFAVVVVGGSGVRAPWSPTGDRIADPPERIAAPPERVATPSGPRVGTPRIAITATTEEL